MARRRIAALVVAAGSLAGVAALWRRSVGRGGDRVELYFADGSMVAFGEGSGEAAGFLPAAERLLAQARGRSRG